jgi:hypothetical protein
MPFRRIWRGRTFDVDAPVENDRCEIEDILAGALQFDPRPCWKTIVALIIEAAENGRPKIEELCRTVLDERTAELLEFRACGGEISLFWFNYDNTIVLCSIAIDRKSRPASIDKALLHRSEYLKEKNKCAPRTLIS